MKVNLASGLIFAIIFIMSCNQVENSNSTTINKIKPELNFFEIDTLAIVSGGIIDIIDDYLLYYDIYATEKALHIYDLETGKYLKSVAEVGDGPNEISQPGFITVDRLDNSIYISDRNRSSLHKLTIDGYQSSYTYPKEFQIMMYHAPISTGGFVTNDVDDKRNILINFDEHQILDTIIFNIIDNEPLVVGDFYQQLAFSFVKHPVEDKYACAYRHYDLIKIVDFKSKEITEHRGPINISYRNNKQIFAGFRWLKPTENFIYAEFVGDVPIRLDGIPKMNYAKRILIFDWGCKLVGQIDIEVPIESLAIDRKRNRIIILTDDEVVPFRQFDFNESEIIY
jgi:hypothetical protein